MVAKKPREERKHRLAIYAVKHGIGWDDVIEDGSGLTEHEVAITGAKRASLFIRQSKRKIPGWVSLFSDQENLNLSRLFNASNAALLIAETTEGGHHTALGL